MPSDLLFAAAEVVDEMRKMGLGRRRNKPLEQQLEGTLIETLADLPPADGEAARIMLGIDPMFRGSRLGVRREHAAEALGVVAGTFRNRHEDRLLDLISRKVAVSLLSSLSPSSGTVEEEAPERDRSRVLIVHERESVGVKEVARLIERLGLKPILWEEALDRSGLWFPSFVERFRSGLDVAQGVVVILEGGSGEPAANVAFEAGLALGLAGPRTVIVQIGDQRLPSDLAGVKILRLRSTLESARALQEALVDAGCVVGRKDAEAPEDSPKGVDAGWYRWTPARAANPLYAEIADAVDAFEPFPTAAGFSAATWLREKALDKSPGVSVHLLMGEGRLEGFIALETSALAITGVSHGELSESYKLDNEAAVSAILIRWICRHRDAPRGTGRELVEFAVALGHEAAENVGSAVLVLEPHDESEATYWAEKYPFRKGSSGARPVLWIPTQYPEPAPGGRESRF